MRFQRLLLLLLLGAFFVPATAAEPDPIQADEQTLKEAKVAADNPALLKFFRERTLTDVQRDKIKGLIARMADEDFLVRERATAELVGMGGQAVSLLRQAINGRDADIEVVRRAERCLETSKAPGIDAVNAAARLLGHRKVDGGSTVLLAYLPLADDESTQDAIGAALVALAVRDGKFDKSVEQALLDTMPLKRGLAAEALVRAGNAEQRQALRKFMQDPDPVVRMRVAVGLAEHKNKESIPVLVDLLTSLPAEHVWRAEDVLCRLAGEQTPNVSVGNDAASRKKCRDAWAEWWSKNEGTADMARITDPQRELGYTLIVQINPQNGQGQVVELGKDAKPRWQINNLAYPVDAQVLRNDRVLIAEYNGQRVTERDFAGKVVWEYRIQSPVACQRLPNGHTFIACHNQMVVVDSTGKSVWTFARPEHDIMTAVRMRNGQTIMIANGGQAVHIDATGKVGKMFAVNFNHQFGGIDLLPNGRIVVPQINLNKVVEFDADGKSVWSATATNPTSAVRLQNGNTLAACFNQQKIVELDKDGKTVWEHKPDGRPWKARRR
ncbi:MAG: PQQ-binding-like beta-propeller repeat protein [Gemmataceae bacterium]|nr:PQQ-binding-like beta-propeller repeat protein [Gemmataceae bacterium]